MCAKLGLTTFRQRIAIERRILKMINEAMALAEPLTGLTEGAVSAWARHLYDNYDAQQIQNLVKIINEISIRSMINTDCSRDVFSTDFLKRSAPLRTICSSLEEALKEIIPFNQPPKLP